MAVIKLIDAATTTGPGPTRNVTVPQRVLQFTSTGECTVQIEASLDGVNWGPVGAPIVMVGASTILREQNAAWDSVRGNVTSITSGSVTVWLGT